jgi:hypothetical protein
MPFRYFIKNLLLPPGIFLLLLLIAWWLRHARPRLSRALFVIGLAGMWAMSLPIVVQWSARGIENIPPLPQDQWATLAQ